MATATVTPSVKKAPVKLAAKPVTKKAAPAPVAKNRTYSFVIVDKNNYSRVVSELVNNQKAQIVAILTDPNVMNSFSVHYFTV